MLRKKISEFPEIESLGDNDEIVVVDKTTNPLLPATKKIKKSNFVPTRESLDIDNVDNTSDEDKPVSTDQAAAIGAKENTGVAQGIMNAHETAFDHDLIETAVQVEADPVFEAWKTATPPAYPGDIPTALSELSDDETHRLVTDTEKSTWNGKQDALGFTPENVANKSTNIIEDAASNDKYPGVKAIKDYADQLIGAANAVVYKGATDCSTNPNFPAGDAGDIYFVSVAGKIGGASGISVEAGDMYICKTDGTLAGDQASVGAEWNVIQKNIADYIIGPASSTDGNFALFDGVTGKLLKNSAYSPSSFDVSGAAAAAQSAAESYADGKVTDAINDGATTIAPSQNAVFDALVLKAPLDSPIFTTRITTPLIYGGAAANDDITIGGTSHATKTTSYVILQPTGGNVGIGTTAPTNILSLGNTSAQKFWIENTATDVVGRALTVAAGGTVAGTSVSDVVGGNLILQSGLGTGTGASTISFQTGTTLTTGMTLQTMSTKMTILGNGNVGIGVTPTKLLHVSNGTLNNGPVGYFENTRNGGSDHGVLIETSGITDSYALRVKSNGVGCDIFQLLDGTTEVFTVLDGGNVGIGQTTPTARLHVVQPSTTTTGVLIKAASNTPTNNLLEIQRFSDSAIGFNIGYAASTGIMNMFLNGNAAIGGSAITTTALLTVGANVNDPAAATQGVNMSRTLGLTATNAQTVTGGLFNVSTSANAFNHTGVLIGGQFQIQNANTATMSNLVGVGALVYNTGVGTVTNAIANNAAIQNLTTGIITNAYGFKVQDITIQGGTLTNTYGVYVGDITSGTQTNTPFSFYAADSGAYNYFAGNVGIGTTSPGSTLTIGSNTVPVTFLLDSATVSYGTKIFNVKERGSDQFYVNSHGTFGGDVFAGTYNLTGNSGFSINDEAAVLTDATVSSFNVGIGDFSSSMVFNGRGKNVTQFILNRTTSGPTASLLDVREHNVSRFLIDKDGNVGIGTTSPTSVLHLKAGTATANTAPLKLTSGTLNTTAEIGTHEYNNDHHLTNWKLVRYSVGGTINESFADSTVGGAEADIYTFTTIANTLGTNGDKLIASYSGNFVTVGTELTQLKAYFAGTAIWDSTGIAVATGTSSWRVSVEIIRVSSTVVRYSVSLTTSGASGFVYQTTGELTGLTLSNTNIMKLTGTSSGVGSGSGDIVGKMYYLKFEPTT